MGLNSSYEQNLQKAAAVRVDGEVVDAVRASAPGALSKLLLAQVGHVAVAAAGHHAVSGTRLGGRATMQGKRVRLPPSFGVVITPSSVYFFDLRLFWGTVKIKREILRLDRDGLIVSVTSGKIATAFALQSADGAISTGFEIGTMGISSAKAIAERAITALDARELVTS